MRTKVLWLVPVLALVAACQAKDEEQPAEQLTFHEIMKDEIDLRADVIWEVGNAAIGDQAGIDPAKMTDAGWDKLAKGAVDLQTSALKLATLDPIVVVKPGVKISDEGTPGGHTGAMVQERMDKDPQKMRDLANTLAAHVGELAAAARAHDAAKAGPLIDQLDGVCESCHLEYWYPDQKALVEEILGQQS